MKVAITHNTCGDDYSVDLLWGNGKMAIESNWLYFTKWQATAKAKRIAKNLNIPIVEREEHGC